MLIPYIQPHRRMWQHEILLHYPVLFSSSVSYSTIWINGIFYRPCFDAVKYNTLVKKINEMNKTTWFADAAWPRYGTNFPSDGRQDVGYAGSPPLLGPSLVVSHRPLRWASLFSDQGHSRTMPAPSESMSMIPLLVTTSTILRQTSVNFKTPSTTLKYGQP